MENLPHHPVLAKVSVAVGCAQLDFRLFHVQSQVPIKNNPE
jgi:hypothetical protein